MTQSDPPRERIEQLIDRYEANGWDLRELRELVAALSTTPAPDPYTDRIAHEIQSHRGTHTFDPHCPFCFFDRFDPETRAAPPSKEHPMSDPTRDLPTRIVVGKNGAYWRDFTDDPNVPGYSMCPVSTDNDPVEPVAVYVRVENPPSPTEDEPSTANGRDLLAHAVQYAPADADRKITAAKIIAIENEAAALSTTPAPDDLLDAITPETTLPPKPTQYRRGWADAHARIAALIRVQSKP